MNLFLSVCYPRCHKTRSITLRVVALTEETVKSTMFWDITHCDLIEAYRRFGGNYFLNFQQNYSYLLKEILMYVAGALVSKEN